MNGLLDYAKDVSKFQTGFPYVDTTLTILRLEWVLVLINESASSKFLMPGN